MLEADLAGRAEEAVDTLHRSSAGQAAALRMLAGDQAAEVLHRQEAGQEAGQEYYAVLAQVAAANTEVQIPICPDLQRSRPGPCSCCS
jgi:hypothetical protein